MFDVITLVLSVTVAADPMVCPATENRDCLDPIESIRSDPDCFCFACGSEDGTTWMLCTSEALLAEEVAQRAQEGQGIIASEMRAFLVEGPQQPTWLQESETDGELVPVGHEEERNLGNGMILESIGASIERELHAEEDSRGELDSGPPN